VFVEQFHSLKNLIARGQTLKGVPYGQTKAIETIGPRWIARRLLAALRNGNEGHLYGYWNDRQGIIGCSPERLCQYDAATGSLTTEAVAGTLSVAKFQSGALLNDTKALREHTLVIDDLRERLSNLGTVEVGATGECPIAGLVHLKTPLRVYVQNERVSMEEIVRHLHPTAALGVYPRNQVGHAWLKESDRRLPRWRFGAPFGISYGCEDAASLGFSFLVAIRNVQWQGQDLRINAGCGVIESSQLECEWQECLSKIRAIRGLLDL
jgi:menaquinone-specific isochorismate synthase